MPSGGGGFLKDLLGIVQLKQQQKQIQDQEEQFAIRAAQDDKQARMTGLSALINAARNTRDPAKVLQLAKFGASQGIADETQLQGLFAQIAPSAETFGVSQREKGVTAFESDPTIDPSSIRSKGMQRDILGVGPGEQRTSELTKSLIDAGVGSAGKEMFNSFGRDFLTRTATGMTPGDRAIDQTLANQNPATLAQILGVKTGLNMTAAQKAQIELGNKENTSRVNIATMQDATEQAKLMLAKSAAGRGLGPDDIPKLLSAQQEIRKHLANADKGNFTPFQIRDAQVSLQAIGKLLQSLGVDAETNFDPKDPNNAFQGWMNKLGNWSPPALPPHGAPPPRY